MKINKTFSAPFFLKTGISALTLLCLLQVSPASVFSQNTYYTRISGSWDSKQIWTSSPNGSSCNCTPGPNDFITVNSGHILTMESSQTIFQVTVQSGGILKSVSGTTLTVSGNTSLTGSARLELSGNFILKGKLSLIDNSTLMSYAIADIDGDLHIDQNASLTAAGTDTSLFVGKKITVNGSLNSFSHIVLDGGYYNIEGTGTIFGSKKIIVRNSNKSIHPLAKLTIYPDFIIEGNFTVTNNGIVTLYGKLDGTKSKSQWTNAASSVLFYQNPVLPFKTQGQLEAIAAGNTVSYSLDGSQDIKTPNRGGVYYHLTLNGTGTKILTGSMVIQGDLTLEGTTQFDVSQQNYTVDLKGNLKNNSIGSPALNSRFGKFIFSGENGTQAISGQPLKFYETIINNAGNIQLFASVSILKSLYFQNGRVVIADNDLIIQSGSGGVYGYDSSKYIITSGKGYLVINHSGIGSITFPVSCKNGSYTPAIINSIIQPDQYGIRVAEGVLSQGTIGFPASSGVVNSTWFVKKAAAATQAVSLTLQWNASDELNNFNRLASSVSNYNYGWDLLPSSQPDNNSLQKSTSALTISNTEVPVSVRSDLFSTTVEDQPGITGIRAFPNPSLENESLQLYTGKEPGKLLIRDLSGREVFASAEAEQTIITIAPEVFPAAGVYFIQWISDGNVHIEKIIRK